LETSGAAFSVALAEDGCIKSAVYMNAGLVHSEKMIPVLSWQLKEINGL